MASCPVWMSSRACRRHATSIARAHEDGRSGREIGVWGDLTYVEGERAWSVTTQRRGTHREMKEIGKVQRAVEGREAARGISRTAVFEFMLAEWLSSR